jgi:hypothetical protein
MIIIKVMLSRITAEKVKCDFNVVLISKGRNFILS